VSGVTVGPRRSWLFTPGTRPDRFARAAEAGADVLIVDLEDAVAPAAKPRARADALAFLAGGGHVGVATALRINALRTPEGLADLAALLAAPGQRTTSSSPRRNRRTSSASSTPCWRASPARRGWWRSSNPPAGSPRPTRSRGRRRGSPP
jgi:hypothetical protein